MKMLIVGGGFVGARLARLSQAAGHATAVVVQSEASVARLHAGHTEAWVGDIGERSFVASLPPADVVVMTLSSRGGGADAYRRIYTDATRHVLAAQPHAHVVLAGSTSVYPQVDGSWVDETTPAEPQRETGRILRVAEELVLASGGAVVRLAGLYGPGRSVLLRQFLLGEGKIDGVPGETEGEGRWVNQLHVDDAAAALAHVAAQRIRGVFNATDGTPLTQGQMARALSQRFGVPVPSVSPPDFTRKRGWSHKRVSPAKLCATGWRPRYPSWLTALDEDPELVPSILRQVTGEAAGQV